MSQQFLCHASLTASLYLVISSAIPAQENPQQALPLPGSQLGILNRKGAVTILAGLPDSLFYSDPVVSPDGKHFAIVASPQRPSGSGSLAEVIANMRNAPPDPGIQIHIFSLPSGPLLKLDGTARDANPAWVPGTNEVSFVRTASVRDSASALMLRKADGSEPAREVLKQNSPITGASWFPNGRRAVIAVAGRAPLAEGKLFTYSLDSPDVLTPLLADKLIKSQPTVSPDGTLLVFVAAEPTLMPRGAVIAGAPRVFVHRFSDNAVVAVEGPNGTNPVWSLTGSEIFFQSSTTGLMYGVRIRPGRALTLDRPREISDFRLENSASSFAVLPGDSLFVIRMARVRATPVAVPANSRGRRASTSEQRTLEFAAATAIVDTASAQGKGFERLVLDTRAYVVSWDPPFAGFSDTAKSYELPSHVASHVSAVAGILKTAGVVPSTVTCISTRPAGCRSGSFPGVVAFSPAIVSADSARISVIRSEDGMAAGGGSMSTFVTWRMTFVRSGREWTLRSIVRFP